MKENPTSVKSKFIRGVIWGIVEKLASLLTGFIITLVLARILTPEDYGLVNMIYIFTVLGTVLLDGGFGQALIQRKVLKDSDISSVFYINIVLSILVYIVLFFCAPLIALFYHQPILINISKVVFLTIPINGFCIIQHSLLTKELKVKELTYVSIISAIISGIIGISLTYAGYGVWALVYQSLSYQLSRTITLWLFSSWRPIWCFNGGFIKEIFSFSINLLGVFTLASIFQNIYTIIIGRLYSVSDVGYYNQALRLQSVASTAITSAVQRVAFPAFAHFQDNMVALKEAYRKVTLVTMSIYFPVMICLIVAGKNLVEVLLTDKWLPAVPMFALLCAAESFYPLNKCNSAVLKALGKGHTYFLLNLANYGIIVFCIILTYKFGIIVLLFGYTISALARSLTSMVVCGRVIKYSFYEQIKDLSSIFCITGITVFFVYLGNLLPFHIGLRLMFSIIFGIIAYIGCNYITKSYIFNEMRSLILKK